MNPSLFKLVLHILQEQCKGFHKLMDSVKDSCFNFVDVLLQTLGSR